MVVAINRALFVVRAGQPDSVHKLVISGGRCCKAYAVVSFLGAAPASLNRTYHKLDVVLDKVVPGRSNSYIIGVSQPMLARRSYRRVINAYLASMLLGGTHTQVWRDAGLYPGSGLDCPTKDLAASQRGGHFF